MITTSSVSVHPSSVSAVSVYVPTLRLSNIYVFSSIGPTLFTSAPFWKISKVYCGSTSLAEIWILPFSPLHKGWVTTVDTVKSRALICTSGTVKIQGFVSIPICLIYTVYVPGVFTENTLLGWKLVPSKLYS